MGSAASACLAVARGAAELNDGCANGAMRSSSAPAFALPATISRCPTPFSGLRVIGALAPAGEEARVRRPLVPFGLRRQEDRVIEEQRTCRQPDSEMGNRRPLPFQITLRSK